MRPSELVDRLRRAPGLVAAVLAAGGALWLWLAPEAARSLLTAFAAVNARVGSIGP